MKSYPKFLALICGSIATTLCFIIQYGSATESFLIRNNIISYTDEGILLTFMAGARPYLIALLIAITVGLVHLLHRMLFRGQEFNPFFLLFVLWLGLVSCIVCSLTNPLPWYGLLAAFLGLTYLAFVFIRFAYPSLRRG